MRGCRRATFSRRSVKRDWSRIALSPLNNFPQIAATTFGRLGGPDDVASLVAYLASPETHFVTGQTVSVEVSIHMSVFINLK